jgi:hypothetical protein
MKTLEDIALENMEIRSWNRQGRDVSVLTEDKSLISGTQAHSEGDTALNQSDDCWTSVGETKRERSFLSFNSIFRNGSDTSKKHNKSVKEFAIEREEMQRSIDFV